MRLAAGRHARRPLLALSALLTAWIAAAPDAGAQPAPAQRWDGYFEMVTGRREIAPATWTETYAANGPSRMSRHPIDREGRYVVFDSDATNLGFSGTALYRRDRRAGRTEVLLAGPARNAAISGDGHHIAFEMCEPYMRPDSAPICDVWALDLRTWTWSLISGLADGTFGNADSGGAALSGDGRFVVFVTAATNLNGALAGTRQVVLRDRDPDGNGVYDEPGSAVLETISIGLAGPGDADSDTPEVSDDGRFVAFRSLGANLVDDDTNAVRDVFLRDRQSATTRRLNVRPQGQQSLSPIDEPQLSMSADGRYVAFSSVDGLLAPASIDDTNGVRDVFVYDRQASSLSRVDVGRVAGAPAPGNASTGWPTLTGDGRYVTLESAATNVDPPPAAGSTQVYVVDRVTGNATRIARAPEGTYNANADTHRAAISADGTVVLFWSVSHFVGYYPTGYEQLFSSVHMSISPAEVTVPARGGEATYTVTTQQHTLWWMLWDTVIDNWVLPMEAPQGVGTGTVRFQAREVNPHPGPRSTTIWLDEVRATLTQEAGLSLTSVTPASGVVEGGTPVTLVGTGFEPGMNVYFNGAAAGVEYVDTTTLRVTTPPSPNGMPQTVPVAVTTQDGRFAWLDSAFQYTGSPDATPPIVMGSASGPEGQNGWFVGDVIIAWAIHDPESSVSTPSCPTVVVTQDTAGTTYSCTATSAGGTTTGSVFVKRDTTPPVITITSPGARQFVAAGAALTLDFTCVDAASGVAVCGMAAPSGAPLDTATPGWKSVAAAASDAAGNLGTVSVEYFVSSGVCLEPLPGLKYWQRFQNDLRDWAGQTQYGGLSNMSYSWMQGVVGTAFYFPSRYYGFMDQYHAGKLDFAGAMTAALWIRPESTGLATLLDNAQQYRLDREADGAIRWTIYGPDRAVEGTGVSTTRTPLNAWSHVTFTYAAGEVKLYIDGRPDGVWTVTPTTLNAVAHSSGDHLIIGAFGPFYATNYYVGGIDDLEMFDRALEPAEIEALFLAAGSGMCPAKATRLEIPNITLRYDAGTLPIRVTLLTVDGEPVAGRTVRITNTVINPQDPAMTLTAVTDATGTVRWDAPLNARPAIYAQGISAISFPDLQYLGAPYTTARVVVEAIPTQVTWATPAPVTYGTALGAAQLNATADVAGSFSYTPGFNTVLAAGTRTLSVRFTPSAVGYAISTTTVTLEVRKAVPVMSVTGGPFTYDGQPHAAVATVRDYRGVALTPVTVTYNGAPAIPVAPGTYAVAATYAGDVNHEPRTVTTTLTIAQATPGISFSAATFTYDGAPHGLTATVTGVGGAALGTVPVTYDGSAAAPVDAGTYTASATFGGDANHAPRTVTTTLRIDRATATVTVDTGSFTFDGQPHPAVATVRGVNGAALSPVTITYGGSSNVPVNAGTYAVVASFAGDTNHLPASATATLVIGRASAVLGWTTLAPISYGTALGAAQLGATASVAGTFQYAPAAGAVLAAGVHTLTATFTPADAQNYQNGTVSTTVTVERAAAAITVGGGPFSYDGQPHGATVAAVGAGGAALTPLTVTYNGSPALPVNAGVYAVAATFAGDTNHQPASAAGTLVIAKAVASLTWATPAPLPYGTPLSAAQLNAAANAPGTFSYAPAAGAVLGVGAGHVLTATFTPADPQNHEGGTVSTTLIIEPATATISVAGGSFVYDGQPHAATASATGVGGVELSPISVTYDGGAAAPVDAGTYVVAATFEGDAYHAARTVTASLTISPAVPTIAIGGGPFVYDGQPHAASVTVTGVGGETLPAAVSLTYAGSTIAPTGVGTYPVQASVAAAGNYAAASTTGTIVIGKATPVVTWTVEPIVYGTNLWDRHHTATANVPGGFAYAEDVMLVLPAGVQTLTATFHPLDWQNYEQTTVTTTILVRRATPTLGLQFYNLVYDGQPHEAGASARGKDWEPLSPVTVTYNGGTEIPRNAGTYVITASYPGNESYEPVSTTITREIYRAAVSSMSWGGGGMLVYGMPIGPEQLQATASVPGTFSYAPGAGTVLPAGSHVITATFTPTDPNYNAGTLTRTFTVSRKTLTVRTDDAAKVYGAALPAFTATFGGFVNGDTPASLAGALVFATAATASSLVGTYPVTPAGLASPNYDIFFMGGTLTIVKAPVAVTLAASPTPSGLDMPITFTATVAAQAAPTAPAGTVRFFDGATLLGTATLSNGTASLLTGGLTAGSHTIEARYDGDASFDIGSRTAAHVVSTAAATPAVTIASSRQPASVGQSVTFTATITVATSGTIGFYDGDALLGTGAIAAGRATLTTSNLAAGSHAITARFQGNASAPPVISPVFVQSITSSGWKDRTTTLSLTSSANPSALGAAVTFTATVSGSSGTPAGRILFMIDGLIVGDPAGVAVTTVSSGTSRAAVSVPGLTGGRHKVTATYLGSSNYRGSNGALTQTVN